MKYAIVYPSDLYRPSIQSLEDLAIMAREGLRDLGDDAEIVTRPDPSRQNIILGAHTPKVRAFPVPDGSIVWNTEQHSHWIENPEYLAYLPGKIVWSVFRGDFGFYVPPGYVRTLERVPERTDQPIDVLFYGAPTPYRDHFRGALTRAGLRAEFRSGLWGEERDQAIAASRVVLSLHWGPGARKLETVRIVYPLINGKACVAETAPDCLTWRMWGGVSLQRRETVVAACLRLARDWRYRERAEDRAYEIARSFPFARVLERALDREPVPDPEPVPALFCDG